MKVNDLSDKEILVIGNEIGDAFFDFKYNTDSGEVGLKAYFDTREKMRRYMKAVVLKAYRSNQLYCTNNREGYVVISNPFEPAKAINNLKLGLSVTRILGLKKSIQYVVDQVNGGKSYDFELFKNKEKYVSLILLVVLKEYQGKGHMSELMKILFKEAAKNNLPIYFDTDAGIKCDKYKKYGMQCVGVRKCRKGVTFYDLYKQRR